MREADHANSGGQEEQEPASGFGAVEAWCDPVAGFLHVANDPCVTRLVRADEAECAEIVEIAEVKRGEDQGEPEEARCG